MKIQKILNNVKNFKIIGNQKILIKKITEDSRIADENTLFIAIKGEKFNGHQFIKNAILNGAKVIMAERLPKSDETDFQTWIVVKNTKESSGICFQNLYKNPQNKLKIIGVTGTNGKTSTATFIYKMLNFLTNNQAALIGTNGGFLGNKNYDFPENEAGTTPSRENLAKFMSLCVKEKIKYLVMEVSSHGAHQKRIAGIDFKIGIFTNLSQDHLDYHQTMQNYAKAKKEFLQSIKPENSVIINLDNEYGSYFKKGLKARIATYSQKQKSTYSYKIIQNDFNGLKILLNNQELFFPKIFGEYNAENLIASVAAINLLGFKIEKLKPLLENITPPTGRMEFFLARKRLIVVDYAHTPDGIKKALGALNNLKNTNSKLIVIFGAGGDRDKTKRPEMGKSSEEYADVIILTTDNSRSEDPKKICQEIKNGINNKKTFIIIDRKKAISYGIKISKENDIIAILGKGHEKYQIIKDKKIDFDDLKIAKELSK